MVTQYPCLYLLLFSNQQNKYLQKTFYETNTKAERKRKYFLGGKTHQDLIIRMFWQIKKKLFIDRFRNVGKQTLKSLNTSSYLGKDWCVNAI